MWRYEVLAPRTQFSLFFGEKKLVAETLFEQARKVRKENQDFVFCKYCCPALIQTLEVHEVYMTFYDIHKHISRVVSNVHGVFLE